MSAKNFNMLLLVILCFSVVNLIVVYVKLDRSTNWFVLTEYGSYMRSKSIKSLKKQLKVTYIALVVEGTSLLICYVC